MCVCLCLFLRGTRRAMQQEVVALGQQRMGAASGAAVWREDVSHEGGLRVPLRQQPLTCGTSTTQFHARLRTAATPNRTAYSGNAPVCVSELITQGPKGGAVWQACATASIPEIIDLMQKSGPWRRLAPVATAGHEAVVKRQGATAASLI